MEDVEYLYICLSCRQIWLDRSFMWDHCPYCGSHDINHEKQEVVKP